MSLVHTATLNSLETERTVIGSILMTENSYPRFKGVVLQQDFFYAEHTRIFEVMNLLSEAGKDINVQTLRNIFKRNQKDEERFSQEYLNEFLEYALPIQVAISSATQVSEMAGRRKLANFLNSFQNDIGNMEIAELLAAMQSVAVDVGTKGVTGQVSHGSVLVANTLKMLAQSKTAKQFLGIEEVDENLFDVSPGETVIVAARPGTGKTALMLKAMRYLSFVQKKKTGFLSLEMYDSKLALRLLAGHCQRNLSDLLVMNDYELEADDELYQGLVDISEKVWIEHEGTFSASTVKAKIQNLVYNHGCEVIFVDYIGLIQGDKTTPGDRQQQVSDISRMLKNMATELRIPIIIACQLNRGVEHRVTNRPVLSDLRESGSIEQDASIVIFLYADLDIEEGMSDKDFQKRVEDSVELPIIFEVAKQRNGPKFRRRLIFNKPIMEFELSENYYSSSPDSDENMPFTN